VKLVVNLLFYIIQFIDGLGDLQMENLMFPMTPIADGQLRLEASSMLKKLGTN
jgi:hypothetical protein